MLVDYKFGLGDTVKIKALNTLGVVLFMRFTQHGKEYIVRYFPDSYVPHEITFFEDELAGEKASGIKNKFTTIGGE